MRFFLSLFFLLHGLSACNEEAEPYERLEKLRALGVASTPVYATPSTMGSPQTVVLTLHIAVPDGDEIEVTSYEDLGARYSYAIPSLTIDESITYDDISGPFQLAEVSASFVAPTQAVLTTFESEIVRMRYGFLVTSGGEEEKVVGDILLTSADNEDVTGFEAVGISIDTPGSDEGSVPVDSTPLELTVISDNDEDFKVGWFVTSGRVKNRRARSTEWQEATAGEHAVIATVRGKDSKSFAIAVRSVTVE